MSERKKVLIINLGSTSSKLAYAEDAKIICENEWAHTKDELKALDTREASINFRKGYIFRFLDENGLKITDMNALAVRGMGKNVSYRHGAYELTKQIGDDCRAEKGGHPGLIAGTIIGDELSREYNIPAYLYDVVPTDEIYELARVCGIKGYRRWAHSHTLNCRATVRKVCEEQGLDFENSTFIVCHIGGGTGTMCVKNGVIVDTYSAEEGGFSPIRAGRVPTEVLVSLYSNPASTKQDFDRVLKKEVGLYGHLGTDDCIEIEKRIAAGDKKAQFVYSAMAYQLSKDIGALATCVNGKVDGIILTGGVAHSEIITGQIRERTGFIAPVIVKPGAMEMEALAEGVTRVLNGEEGVNSYDEALKPHDLYESVAE